MTALTIWLIGYLYTLGIERRLCDEKNEAMELEDALRLIVTWPYYLGYLWVFQKALEDKIEQENKEFEKAFDSLIDDLNKQT